MPGKQQGLWLHPRARDWSEAKGERQVGPDLTAPPYRARACSGGQEPCRAGLGWMKAGVKRGPIARRLRGETGRPIAGRLRGELGRQTWAGVAEIDSRTT